MQRTPCLIRSAREERKSVTETDLVTADDSTENHKLSNSVTTDSSADHDASGSATEANTSGSDGSLSTMVLNELRALAKRDGVKGKPTVHLPTALPAARHKPAGARLRPTTPSPPPTMRHALIPAKRDRPA